LKVYENASEAIPTVLFCMFRDLMKVLFIFSNWFQ